MIIINAFRYFNCPPKCQKKNAALQILGNQVTQTTFEKQKWINNCD